MGLVINPPGLHRQASQNSMLLRVAADSGIRDTLRDQIIRSNDAEQKVLNPIRTHRHPDVYCWCQAEIVQGTWDRIARGLTESCGTPDCKEPE